MTKNKYIQLKNQNWCERCNDQPAKIRCVYHKEQGRTEYICVDCKLQDPQLKGLPIKPKQLSEAEKEVLFAGLDIPISCDRCTVRPPKIRKFDNADNSVEFICHKCKQNDKALKKLQIKKKPVIKNIHEF